VTHCLIENHDRGALSVGMF